MPHALPMIEKLSMFQVPPESLMSHTGVARHGSIFSHLCLDKATIFLTA